MGLGANLGERLDTLRAAARALADASGVELLARSSVYETPPAGGPVQGPYLNAAVAVRIDRSPHELLAITQAIEQRFGRVRTGARWEPRTLDLDLLWWSGGVVDTPELVVPHPRLAERAFGLVPLVEIWPDARDPRSGELYAAHPLARAALQRVTAL